MVWILNYEATLFIEVKKSNISIMQSCTTVVIETAKKKRQKKTTTNTYRNKCLLTSA